MARLYEVPGGENEDVGGCPGETECDVWKSSDPAADVRCPSCPKRFIAQQVAGPETGDTEPLGPEAFEESLLLDRVDRLRRERNSGRAIYQTITAQEWEALVIWDEMIADCERARQTQLLRMLATVTGI